MNTSLNVLGTPVSRLGVVFLVLFSACTILEDSDLRSPADFTKLHLESVRIIQEINDRTKLGSNNSNSIIISRQSMATILTDSIVHGVDGVSHVVWYALTALGDNKLKFRSGTTGSVRIYVYYTDTDEPYSLGVVNSADEVVEVYRFRYDESGELSRINTFVVRAPGDTLSIRDSIFYSSDGKIDEIRRNDSDLGPGTATLDYRAGTPELVSHVNYSSGITVQYQGPGSCGNLQEANFYCADYGLQSSGPLAEVDLAMLANYSMVDVVRLTDPRNGNNGSCQNCGRDFDTYYFHPTMFLANGLQHGFDLLEYYMRDWLVVAPMSSNNQGQISDETVSFQFVYTTTTP